MIKLKDLINEATNEKVLYRFEFNPKYTLAGKQVTPKWAILTDKECNMLRKKAAVLQTGGYGYHKSISTVWSRMDWEKTHRPDPTAEHSNLITFDELSKLIFGMSKTK